MNPVTRSGTPGWNAGEKPGGKGRESRQRHVLLQHARIEHLADLEPIRVFKAAVVDTAMLIAARLRQNGRKATVWRGLLDHQIVKQHQVSPSHWKADPELIFNLQAAPWELDLLAKMEEGPSRLAHVLEYSQGVIPYKTRDEGQQNLYISPEAGDDENWRPLLESASQVERYWVDTRRVWIRYGPWLWCPRDPKYFARPKILFHRLRKKLPRQLIGAIDESGAVNRHSLSNLITRNNTDVAVLYAALAIFNSAAVNWWFVKRYGVLMEVGGFKVGRIPLPPDWETSRHQLAVLAKQLTTIRQRLPNAASGHRRMALSRQIAALDRQIDDLVYQLYALTEEEVRIVEEATGR